MHLKYFCHCNALFLSYNKYNISIRECLLICFKNKLECAVDGAPSQVSTLVAVVANSIAEGGTGSRTLLP